MHGIGVYVYNMVNLLTILLHVKKCLKNQSRNSNNKLRNYCIIMLYVTGIHAEIAGTRYEYWSSFAPLPVEVVLAAGQMAKDENVMGNLVNY